MRRWRQTGLLLAIICIIHACRTDDPTMPDMPGYESTAPVVNTNAVTGTTGSGADLANSNLTGTWTAKITTYQFYNQNNAVLSSTILPNNLFTAVTLNESGRILAFSGAPDVGSYQLTSDGGNLYIQLTSDPFNRSLNDKVWITNLTSTSMTWVAIDPQILLIGGQTLRSAYQVTFTK